MRLICPNCHAQYEVPREVIPAEGRDVQCSDCDQTWFQEHPDPDPDTSPRNDEEITSSGDAPVSQPATETPPEPGGPPAQPVRRKLDPTVADVLRAEAELEQKARQSKAAGSMESQPDLGLEDADTTAQVRQRARDARDSLHGKTAPARRDATAVSASRRDLLPDIEEINSTLRSNSDRTPGEDAGQTGQLERQEKRNFGLGFSLMAGLAAVLVLTYAFAPQIAEAVPQSDPWISAYVGQIDQLRMRLDAQAEALLSWLDDTAASSVQ